MRVFAGPEVVVWHSVRLEVDPGENEGFFLFFAGASAACGDAEVHKIVELCDSRPTVFFDIGANIGLMSLAVAAACPNTRVVAFEPDSSAVERFRRNLSLNPELSSRIELHQLAVADRNGAVPFFPGDPGNSELGSLFESGNSEREDVVRCTRLDSFCHETGQTARVAKIDVEGAEVRVLEGMSNLLRSGLPDSVLLEVHAGRESDSQPISSAVYSLLLDSGYRLCEFADGVEVPCRPPDQWPGRLHLVARRAG